MRGIRAAGVVGLGRALVTSGLILPLLPGLVLAQGADQAGQTMPNAQQLIDRLEQIQGEIGGAQAGGGESKTPQSEPSVPSAQGLIERLRQIGSDPGAGQAQAPKLSEEQVRSRLQDELGVQVLGLRVVDPNGPPAYEVRVMNPPGNYNAAFLVSTLLVDGETGEILGQPPEQPTMADPDRLPESFRPGLDASGPEIRRRTY